MLKHGILFIIFCAVGISPSYGVLSGGGTSCCVLMSNNASSGGCSTTASQYNCDGGQIVYTCDTCDNYSYTRVKAETKTLCSGGSVDIYTCLKCSAGQYIGDGQCKNCPSPGTSASGNGSITDCYKAASTTTSSDSTGSYTITYPKCYYTE